MAHVLPLSHRVPAVGYLICEARDKLKPEFFGVAGTEIAQLRRTGVEVTNRVELPLIAYLGDTRTVPVDALYKALRAGSCNNGTVNMDRLLAGQPQSPNHQPGDAYELFRVGDAVSSRDIHCAILDSRRLCKDL